MSFKTQRTVRQARLDQALAGGDEQEIEAARQSLYECDPDPYDVLQAAYFPSSRRPSLRERFLAWWRSS